MAVGNDNIPFNIINGFSLYIHDTEPDIRVPHINGVPIPIEELNIPDGYVFDDDYYSGYVHNSAESRIYDVDWSTDKTYGDLKRIHDEAQGEELWVKLTEDNNISAILKYKNNIILSTTDLEQNFSHFGGRSSYPPSGTLIFNDILNNGMYVDLGDLSFMTSTDECTITFNIVLDDYTEGQRILSFNSINPNSSIQVDSNGGIRLGSTGIGGSINDNYRIELVITRNLVSLYSNGVKIDENSGLDVGVLGNLYFGQNNISETIPLLGKIYDIAIYDYARPAYIILEEKNTNPRLTQDNILRLYTGVISYISPFVYLIEYVIHDNGIVYYSTPITTTTTAPATTTTTTAPATTTTTAPATTTTTTSPPFYSYSQIFDSSYGGYVGGVLTNNNKVVGVPHNAGSDIVIYDYVGNYITYCSIYNDFYDLNSLFFGGVLLGDGQVCLIPYGSYCIGLYNPETNLFTVGPQVQSYDYSCSCGTPSITTSNYMYAGGVVVASGIVVMAPYDSTRVGEYNPITNTYTQTAIVTQKYKGCVLLDDGNVLLIPFSSNQTKIYNPITKILSNGPVLLSINNVGGVTLNKPNNNVLILAGYSVITKYHSVYDTLTNTVTNNISATGIHSHGGIVLPNNDVILMSVDTITPINVLRDNSTYTYITDPRTVSYRGGVATPDGRVVLLSASSTVIGRILTDQVITSQFALDNRRNKF